MIWRRAMLWMRHRANLDESPDMAEAYEALAAVPGLWVLVASQRWYHRDAGHKARYALWEFVASILGYDDIDDSENN